MQLQNRDHIDALMRKGLADGVFPGAVLLVGAGDTMLFHRAYGQADLFAGRLMTKETVFDLASLTKPLATTLAVARLVDDGRLALDDTLASRLPALAAGDKAAITMGQLLTHTSGLPAHRLYYMKLRSLAAHQRAAAIMDLLAQTPIVAPPGTTFCYSDLGFMLLCRVVEKVVGGSMAEYLSKQVYGPLGLADLFFADLFSDRRPQRDFAATELCPIRKRLLVGEVHDDNAWYAGGIDGHAGLFGTAAAVFNLLRALMADWRGLSAHPIFTREVLGQIFGQSGDAFSPLGFDRPAKENSSAGQFFSSRSIGHLGFAGTSFWLDLDADLSVVLLTNRVHPTRWNNQLLRFRPRIHDAIRTSLENQTLSGGD